MARYIAAEDLQGLADQYGVSVSAVRAFIQEHRTNGNIGTALTHVRDNPGVNEVDVAAAVGTDGPTTDRILGLLTYLGMVEEV